MRVWKKIITLAAAAALAAAMSMTAFAGTSLDGTKGDWRKDDTGWWWQNEDGTWLHSGWFWLDGNNDGVAECYYFGPDGYMYAGTTTPDGYTVNADGAWVENDTAQQKEVTSAAVPDGSKTAEEIISYLTKYNSKKSPIYLRRLNMTAENGKVRIGNEDYRNGWFWYRYDGDGDGGPVNFFCVLAVDENGYLMTNCTTPDGYQVDEYGRLCINGTIVTHVDNCRMLGGTSIYDKTGALVTDKNGGWDLDKIDVSGNSLHMDNYVPWTHSFGNLIYAHVYNNRTYDYGYGYSDCVQYWKEGRSDRFESDY